MKHKGRERIAKRSTRLTQQEEPRANAQDVVGSIPAGVVKLAAFFVPFDLAERVLRDDAALAFLVGLRETHDLVGRCDTKAGWLYIPKGFKAG